MLQQSCLLVPAALMAMVVTLAPILGTDQEAVRVVVQETARELLRATAQVVTPALVQEVVREVVP